MAQIKGSWGKSKNEPLICDVKNYKPIDILLSEETRSFTYLQELFDYIVTKFDKNNSKRKQSVRSPLKSTKHMENSNSHETKKTDAQGKSLKEMHHCESDGDFGHHSDGNDSFDNCTIIDSKVNVIIKFSGGPMIVGGGDQLATYVLL